VACLINGLAYIYQLLLALMLGFFSVSAQSTKPCYLRHLPHQGWSLSMDGEHYDAIDILPSTVIMSYLMILHYADLHQVNNPETGQMPFSLSSWFWNSRLSLVQRKRLMTLVIFRFNLSIDDYRHLAVRLKLSNVANSH
jgi:hypothetical protein